jgi:MFS family permease
LTFLSGLTNSCDQRLISRSLQGLGFGGEWAVGYAIAVLISTILLTILPASVAWRVFFCIGIAPALLVIWIQRNIEEAPVFSTADRVTTAMTSLWEVFSGPYRPTVPKAVLLIFGIYGGNYVMITWLPAYLKLVLNLSIASVGGYLAITILGSFAGAFLAELLPTHIRGTAQGFTGNAGRATGAVMPTIEGILHGHQVGGGDGAMCLRELRHCGDRGPAATRNART